jgi:septum formation protein
MKLTDYHIILASNSPRRKELLSGIDVDYTIKTLRDVDESYPVSMPKEEIAEFVARRKASVYLPELKENELFITADTVVLLNNTILGKPVNKADAKRMLHMLSGKTHRVITGVCMATRKKKVSFSDTTFVTFGKLFDTEIDYYVEKYLPLDKAGAYGIQEWIGYAAVECIGGSYFNVMGLPIYKVYRALVDHFGMPITG